MNERQVISITKTIPAPLPYVFDWCTDFREDDHLITGSTGGKKNIERAGDKVTYVSEQEKSGRIVRRNYVVTLMSPDRWHVEARGEEKDSTGDYRLYSEGDGTRFEMTFDMTYKVGPGPPKEEVEREDNEEWDKYVAALVADYRQGKPAK